MSRHGMEQLAQQSCVWCSLRHRRQKGLCRARQRRRGRVWHRRGAAGRGAPPPPRRHRPGTGGPTRTVDAPHLCTWWTTARAPSRRQAVRRGPRCVCGQRASGSHTKTMRCAGTRVAGVWQAAVWGLMAEALPGVDGGAQDVMAVDGDGGTDAVVDQGTVAGGRRANSEGGVETDLELSLRATG